MNRLLPRSPPLPARLTTPDLFEDFDRLRSQLWDTFGEPEQRVGGWLPALGDLEEKDDEFVVNVEVPGFDRDDIRVEVEGRRLIVHAERDEEQREGTVRSSTRTGRHLHHETLLPSEVDEDGIEACLDRGVLRVRVPETQEASRRQIEIG